MAGLISVLETFNDAVEKSKVTSAVGAGKTQKRRFSSNLSLSSLSLAVNKLEKRKGLAVYVTYE